MLFNAHGLAIVSRPFQWIQLWGKYMSIYFIRTLIHVYICTYVSLYTFTCILIFIYLYLKIKHIISLYFQLKCRLLSFNLISSILQLYMYHSLMSEVFFHSITNIISNFLNSKIHNSLRITTPMLPQRHVLRFFFNY